MKAIHIGKINLSCLRYQIMIIGMLNNYSPKYSSHYIIKFVYFIPIYYAINLDIVSCLTIYILDLLMYYKF